MSGPWGRFTLRGSDAVEARITELVQGVADRCRAVLDPAACRALVMLGGFGRGEGGVVMENGEEFPHNNIDFLLITKTSDPAEQNRLREVLAEACRPATSEHGIAIDVSVIGEAKLRHAPCLVIWYDMRFGHKTILGDETFVPSLRQFERDRIPAWDVRNLIVNRGTLLVINDQLLGQGNPSSEGRRLVIKHAMKAIIGYGDALLYFLGDYDWSYREKQRRMRERGDIDGAFRALYDAACEFRFQPSYEAYLERDLEAWMDELQLTLGPIHLACEERRLATPNLTWEGYPGAALRHAVWDEPLSLRSWAKKVVNATRSGAAPAGMKGLARLGYRMLGIRGLMPIVFPAVAYHLENPEFSVLAQQVLCPDDASPDALRRAYLRKWGEVGDVNFSAVLTKYNLSLDAPEPVL